MELQASTNKSSLHHCLDSWWLYVLQEIEVGIGGQRLMSLNVEHPFSFWVLALGNHQKSDFQNIRSLSSSVKSCIKVLGI